MCGFNNITVKEWLIIKTIDRLNDIGSLSYNWDGYDAKPFNFELINKCKKIVRILSYQPDIYPTGRQSIQFQCELSNKSYLEFEIFNNKTLCLWVSKRNYINAKEIEIVVSEEEHIKEIVDSFYENNGSLGWRRVCIKTCFFIFITYSYKNQP